jgi:hypothetical protein
MITLDPARLERIWHKCPELRPVIDGSRLEYGSVLHLESWCISSIGPENYVGECGPDLAAALIRDRCVLWLMERADDTGKSFHFCLKPDPTKALLLAVEAALGITG